MKKVELATFRCPNCDLPYPLDHVRRCQECGRDFCKECAEHEYHLAHRQRGPKATWIKGPERTPGYYKTLLFTVVYSALFISALVAYLLVEPPLQDTIGILAILFFAAAIIMGFHHIWKYRMKKVL